MPRFELLKCGGNGCPPEEAPQPTITIRWREYDRKMHLESWLLCVDVPFAGYQEFPIPDPMSLLVDQWPSNPTAADRINALTLSELTEAVIERITGEFCDDGFEYTGSSSEDCCAAWEQVYETVTCTDAAKPVIEEWLATELSKDLFGA